MLGKGGRGLAFTVKSREGSTWLADIWCNLCMCLVRLVENWYPQWGSREGLGMDRCGRILVKAQ